MNLRYGSILDLSEADWPGRVSSVLFLGGCPLKCGYCFNSPLVLEAEKNCGEAEVAFFIEHFKANKKICDSVVLSGGEPLHQANALKELVAGLKREGLQVKLDTSGFYPEALESMLRLVDWVAMDLKTRPVAAEYAKACGYSGDAEMLLSNILRSVTYIENSEVFKEFRTTIVPGLNDSANAVEEIARLVPFADTYALQAFRPGHVVSPDYAALPPTPREKLLELAGAAKNHIKRVVIRSGGSEEEA